MKIGLEYDKNLVHKFKDINKSLKENNQGMCSVWGEPFDEDDPEMKPLSLVCGH